MANTLPPQPIQTIANNADNKLPAIWSSYQLAIQNAIDNFAPNNAQYVVTQSNSQLSNEFVLANLTTGFLKVTTTSGNLTSHPTLDPTDLSPTGVFPNTYNVNGNNFITVNAAGQITLANDVIITAAPSGTASGDLTGSYPSPTIASIQGTTVSATTGTGNVVFSTSPTLVTPLLGTPTSGTLTNCTGYTEANVSFTDTTTNDSSTTKHGYLKKLSNVATQYMDGTGAWSTPTGSAAATQAEQETGTSTTVFVSPGRQQYHPSAAKMWVQVTYSAGVPSATTKYNVSSLTDSAGGDGLANLTTAFSSTNYAVVATNNSTSTRIQYGAPSTASAVRWVTNGGSDDNNTLVAFGDQ